MASSSQTPDNTPEIIIDNHTVDVIFNDLKNFLIQDFDQLLEEDLYDHFSTLITRLTWHSSNLNTQQFGFFSSAKLLSDIMKFELPALKAVNSSPNNVCTDFDTVKAQLNSYSESIAEKKKLVNNFHKELVDINKQITNHENALIRLRERRGYITKQIRTENELILLDEESCVKLMGYLADCGQERREHDEKQQIHNARIRSLENAWENLQALIRLI